MSTEVDAEFEAALLKDAGTAAGPPEIPAPPRLDREPDAPHGRAGDGTPLAPYGLKADGVPRIKPAGPGAPRRDDKPRVTASAPSGPKPGTPGRDYAPGLMATGKNVWLLLSMNEGFGIGKRKAKDGTVRPLIGLPDTRPYAAVFKNHLPLIAATWSDAANQNATVRHWVSKVAGDDEGIGWMLGVAFSSAMFLMGCKQLAVKENEELRAHLAEKNDADLKEFFQQMLEEMGAAA